MTADAETMVAIIRRLVERRKTCKAPTEATQAQMDTEVTTSDILHAMECLLAFLLTHRDCTPGLALGHCVRIIDMVTTRSGDADMPAKALVAISDHYHKAERRAAVVDVTDCGINGSSGRRVLN